MIVVFHPLFTNPTWEYANILLLAALLARGKRIVTACLRVVGRADEEHFQNYHRVLNCASWSALAAARALLGLILLMFSFALGDVWLLAADDTVERRRGRRIKQVCCYRDPVRSSKKHVSKGFGLKWLVLVKLPWALPFFTVLCPAQLDD